MLYPSRAMVETTAAREKKRTFLRSRSFSYLVALGLSVATMVVLHVRLLSEIRDTEKRIEVARPELANYAEEHELVETFKASQSYWEERVGVARREAARATFAAVVTEEVLELSDLRLEELTAGESSAKLFIVPSSDEAAGLLESRLDKVALWSRQGPEGDLGQDERRPYVYTLTPLQEGADDID